MLFQISNALFRFVNAGDVTRWHPPQRNVHAGKLLEPLLPLPEYFGMRRAIDVISERFDRFPDRHIQEYAIVMVVWPKVRCVSFSRLETPYESRAVIGKRVDFVKPAHEPGHCRVIKRSLDSTNVDLSDVVFIHLFSPSLVTFIRCCSSQY